MRTENPTAVTVVCYLSTMEENVWRIHPKTIMVVSSDGGGVRILLHNAYRINAAQRVVRGT